MVFHYFFTGNFFVLRVDERLDFYTGRDDFFQEKSNFFWLKFTFLRFDL